MTHEVGHLVGRPHSDVPGQLMSPVYSEPLEACLGPAPGAPEPAAVPEPDVAEAVVSLQQPRRPVAKKPLSSKTAKKNAKTKKRCTRRFRAGRRTLRCVKPQRKASRTRARR
jgi:hypothetical protein